MHKEEERKAKELRKNIARAKDLIIGNWKRKDGKGSLWYVTYKSDSTEISKSGDFECVSKWYIKENEFFSNVIKYRATPKSKWENVSYVPNGCQIIYIDHNKLSTLFGDGSRNDFYRVK